MLRIRRTFVAFVVLAVLATATSVGASAPTAEAQPAWEGFEEMVDAIENNGDIQVVIQFSSTTSAFDEASVARSTVETSGAVFKASLTPEVQVTYNLLTIPFVAATVTSVDALEALRTNPLVLSVQIDHEYTEAGSAQAEESVEWMMDQARPGTEADQMHAAGFTGAGQTVAVVDSGIDRTHTALDHAIVYERCIIASGSGRCPNGSRVQSGSGAAVDFGGHGTLVAGTIVSDGTGASEVGMAPAAKLEVYKVTTSSGIEGSSIAGAFDWISANRPGVSVVNLSIGRGAFTGTCAKSMDPMLSAAIDRLVAKGVMVVAAAGNGGNSGRTSFPACLANVVNVAASLNFPAIASFSDISSETDVAAPGSFITTTEDGGGNATVSGTSFASPITAGCALLLRQAGYNTAATLKTRLTTSTQTATRGGFTVPFLNCSPPCAGKFVTTNLAAGDVPTSGPDVILGSSASETINGAGGNDVICAAGGNDTVFGGGGNDTIYGQSGHDILAGGAGDDLIYGNSGNDTIQGNDGKDRIIAGDGNDIVSGGPGNDKLFGRNGNDTMTGGDGADALYGEAGLDRLFGGPGNDYMSGGGQLDKVNGDGDNDTIVGDGDNDILQGGSGDDTILGAAGKDLIYGQDGDDVLTGNGGHDTIQGDNGNDTLIGSSGNDTLYGRAGNDKLYGRAGNDRLYGEAGNDQIFGEAGNDIIHGGTGTDTCSGGSGSDSLKTCP